MSFEQVSQPTVLNLIDCKNNGDDPADHHTEDRERDQILAARVSEGLRLVGEVDRSWP